MTGLLFLFTSACTLGATAKDSGMSPELGDDSDTSAAGQAPSVLAVTSACSANIDGVDTWTVSATVSDPQGTDEIEPVGSTVTVLASGGSTLATYALACAADECWGSWQADAHGVDCAVGRASTFRFVVVDEDGHASAPYDYTPA